MKMYVWYYGPHEEDSPLTEPRSSEDNYDIFFKPERGGLLLNDLVSAQYELEQLTRMRVHSGKHFCRFELEEEDGIFAIVCKEHTQIMQDGFTFDTSWIDDKVAQFTDQREVWAVRMISIDRETAAAEAALKDMLQTSPNDAAGHAHSRAYIDALKRTRQKLRGHPER